MHYCQFDANGVALAASYPLDAAGPGIPAAIRVAYGVEPHPDMPHSIFLRMKKRLAEPGGGAGYFLCRDAEGCAVWISVNLYPTQTGLMACHFEVTSKQLSQMMTFFSGLRAAERDFEAKHASAGEDALADGYLKALAAQSLKDYRSNALLIMVDEVFVRYAARTWPQRRQLQELSSLFYALDKIDELGEQISVISERSRLIPYQLKLQAARLESGSGPISVIASNHQELTASLLGITHDILAASGDEIDRVCDAMAYLAQSNHSAELLTGGITRASTEPLSASAIADMNEVIDDCEVRVTAMMANIDKSALALLSISKRMRRALSAMEMTRLMCKVERANVPGPTESLGNIVDQLHETERTLTQVMCDIDDVAKRVLVLVKRLDLGAHRLAA